MNVTDTDCTGLRAGLQGAAAGQLLQIEVLPQPVHQVQHHIGPGVSYCVRWLDILKVKKPQIPKLDKTLLQIVTRNADGVGHVDEEPDLGACAGQVLTRSVFKREESYAPVPGQNGRYLYIVLFALFFL